MAFRSHLPNRIALPAHPEEVQAFAAEISPASVGLPRAAVEAIWSAVHRLYRTALYPAIALCVRHRGQVILDRAIGHVRGNAPGGSGPLVPVTPKTPFCIFSASKAVTAMLIHLLDDRGLLHVDDQVGEYLPEFARHGKRWVTIRHVLTHRAGLPTLPQDRFDPELLLHPEEVVRMLCDARPTFRPGRRLAYHAITGGYLLGEVVRRVTGKRIDAVLREALLDPLGFQTLDYGYRGPLADVAENAFTGPPPPLGLARVVKNALGVTFAEACALSNTEAWLQAVVPAGNIVANANEFSRFFQLLLNQGELDGTRVFDARTVRRATTETAWLELDLTVLWPVRYGVGLMLGADRLSVFGPRTRHAFGHLGFINVFGWADPDRELAVGLLTSGKPFATEHLIPLGQLLRTISDRIPARTG